MQCNAIRRCTQSSKPSQAHSLRNAAPVRPFVCVDFAVGGDACARHRALGRRHSSLRRTRSMGRAERGRPAKPLPVVELFAANACQQHASASASTRAYTATHWHWRVGVQEYYAMRDPLRAPWPTTFSASLRMPRSAGQSVQPRAVGCCACAPRERRSRLSGFYFRTARTIRSGRRSGSLSQVRGPRVCDG